HRVEARHSAAVAHQPDEGNAIGMRVEQRPAAIVEPLVDDAVIASVDEVCRRLRSNEVRDRAQQVIEALLFDEPACEAHEPSALEAELTSPARCRASIRLRKLDWRVDVREL